jgi:uncharacterized membrane protein
MTLLIFLTVPPRRDFFFYNWHGIFTNELMRNGLLLFIIFLSACKLPKDQDTDFPGRPDTATSIQTNASYDARKEDPVANTIIPAKPKTKKPSGIYQTTLPIQGKMQQTIAFYDDQTFQLQETYPGKKDSVVVTQGNWSPSDGYIWLYKDQVVRGRYTWKGDTLQYFNPLLKKNFNMHPLKDAIENAFWSDKQKQGVAVWGVGNEPFWNVQVKKQDSISFLLPEWTQPVTLKINSATNSTDSIAYTAKNDSTQIRLTIYPLFCSDGMSDYVYRNKVRMEYNKQVFNGCGIVYR